MIRKTLLSGVAMLALCGTANAQIPVTDIANLAVNKLGLTEQVRQVIAWGKQAADMAHQIVLLKQQYDELVSTYNALAHITDVASALGAFGGIAGTWMPPGSDLPSILYGAQGLWGTASSFARVNSVEGFAGSLASGSWQMEELLRRSTSTANFQALAQAATLDAQTHITALAALEARLGACADVTCNTAIGGEISLYQQNLDAHRAQIENIKLAMEAQKLVDQQRQEQQRFKMIQAASDATRRVTGPLQ